MRPTVLSVRTYAIPRRDTRVPYHQWVGVNREAWAELVGALVDVETDGNKSRFARLVNVEYKTINRWMRGEVDVSEESVRKVARALGRSPIHMLIEVGYYSPEDLADIAPRPALDANDPALKAIARGPWPPHIQYQMVRRLEEIRARQRQRQHEDELTEVQWWIEQWRRGA